MSITPPFTVRFALILVVALATGCTTIRSAHQGTHSIVGDDQLYTEITGAGDRTIVFLPGLLGSTSYWKAAKLDTLGTEARLIYLDELGFGRSPWPSVDYTLDDHLGAIRRTLVAHGATRRVTIVAHSFGTILAAYYAERYQDEVEALYLFGTPVYSDEAEAKRHVGEMSGLAGLLVKSRPLARIVCAVHNGLMPLSSRLAPYMRTDLPPEVARDGALHFWPSLVGSVYNVIGTKPIETPLRLLGTKVTFVHGKLDTVTEIERVRSLATEIQARLIVTDDVHGSYWKDARSVLDSARSDKAGRTDRRVP
jgi:pimeloyl-ACP methyl ester carboxylesterase